MIVCQNCGSVDDFTEKQAGPHVSAYCNGCGKYIKHLPQNRLVLVLYFGKYKGRYITSMTSKEEVDYLKWLSSAEWVKTGLKESIDAHLDEL